MLPAPKNGFSMIEILLVLVLAALLFLGGITTYRLLYQKTDLNKSAQEVGQVISTMRLESIAARHGMKYGVHFENNSYSSFSDNPSNVINNYNLPSNISITSINLANTTSDLIFDKLTGHTNNFGTIVLSYNGQSVTISINSQGTIGIQ